MPVVKPVRSKTLLATLSVLVVVAGMLFGANVASADSVQYQSYQRASQTEACAAQPGETPWQASWGADSSWSPSWEQWANKGAGGWVCTRSITWAKTPIPAGGGAASGVASCATGGPYALGDIGPGCGLVFLISGGLTYEMAPNTWSGGIADPTIEWCNTSTSVTTGTAVGTGSANTTAMLALPCTSGAGVSARAYRGGGLTDWFLPSKDELNAMCNYSRNPTAPAAPSVSCFGSFPGSTQNGAFAAGTYGFASADYWSSSQATDAVRAWAQYFLDGSANSGNLKTNLRQVRPVRAF